MTNVSTTLLVNGRVHSPTHPDATAMAIRDGVVAWLGSDDVGRRQFVGADVVDLEGGFVAPGFVDSHIHLTTTGLTLTGLDLRTTTSRPALPAPDRRLRDGAPRPAAVGSRLGRVVVAGGRVHRPPQTSTRCSATGPPTWPASTSTRRWRRPVCAGASKTLASASGFDDQRPLVGDAHHAVRAAARDLLTDDQRAEARAAALDAAAANGIVAVHECAGPEIGGLDDWHQLRALDHGVEVIGYWGEAVSSPAQARAVLDDTGAAGLAGDLFVDGALGSRTAWLHQPYQDAAHHTGTCYLDTGASRHGAPAGVHRGRRDGRLPRDR